MVGELRVCDFFCGAGGFSEGFRQKGFRIVFALDIWKPAIDTHALNHPGCRHAQMDIKELDSAEKIDSIVPDTEIIIGSPPCVAFSYSNRGGNADKKEGKLLVEAFLRVIAWKKKKGVLKYWLLENVPNLRLHMKDAYTFNDLNLPGGDEVALRVKGDIYDSSDYGAPQRRKRFVCGEFPAPNTNNKKISLGDVITSLKGRKNYVNDPVYGYKIPRERLSDHYYDSTIEQWRWQKTKRLKRDSGFFGKMSFPDRMDLPSRTVMANSASSSREAIVLPGTRKGTYRSPTVRELASLMSFPIDYLFQAASIGNKRRLIGNAVCPALSSALAEAIARSENLRVPRFKRPEGDIDQLMLNLNGIKIKKNKQRDKKQYTRFAKHIDYLKYGGFRVELDNKDSDFIIGRIVWTARLHSSAGRDRMKYVMADSDAILSLLKKNHYKMDGFLEDLEKIISRVPDSSAFQIQYCSVKKEREYLSPEQALQQIKKLVEKHFPRRSYFQKKVTLVPGAFTFYGNKVDELKVPIQFIAGFLACQRLVESTEKGNSFRLSYSNVPLLYKHV